MSSSARRTGIAGCCALLLLIVAVSTASAGTVGQKGRVNNATGKEVCSKVEAFSKSGSVCARLVVSFSWDFNKVTTKQRVSSPSYRIQTRTTSVGSLYSLRTSSCSGRFTGPAGSTQSRFTWNCRVVFRHSERQYSEEAPVPVPPGTAFASGSFVG